jgi:thioredoxin 1
MAELTNDNLQEVIKSVGKPVLVDMYAEWCGPCKMIHPIIDDLIKEYDGKLEIIKVNVDVNPVTAAAFSVRSIPTLLVFDKTGELKKKQAGAIPKSQIVALFESYIV